MANRNLRKKPLNEAIVELRWSLPDAGGGFAADPNYKLLIGRFFERVIKDYPTHEPLPTASMPDEMVPHIVQHRFRKGPDQWPLIQIGPGVVTFNETASYDWQPFCQQAEHVVKTVFDAYPPGGNLGVISVLLRYIDVIVFDYEKNNLLDFLKDQLHVDLAFPMGTLNKYGVAPLPIGLAVSSTFVSTKPVGRLAVKITTATKGDEKAIVLETILESKDKDVPKLPGDFANWANQAHDVTTDLFFEMIEGPLKQAFE